MATKRTVRAKKKVRKNIEYGVAHISSTFNNTIVTLTDKAATQSLGLQRAVSVSEARASQLPSLHKWRQRLRLRRLWNTA